MAARIKELRDAAEELYKEALLAADPEEAVHRYFRQRGGVLRVGDVDYFLNQFKRVFVIGAGKASVRMSQAVETILGDAVAGGLVITSRGQAGRLRKVLVREAGHPLPDDDGARATEEMIELVSPLSDHDLVVCVLSGGGSALLTAPQDGISMSDLQRVTRLFLASGMDINEINIVRKHICRVKGGRLAEMISPATVITLILSDVIGDKLDVIASGPCAQDPSTYGEAIETLEKRGIWEQVPGSIREVLTAGEAGVIAETPKPDSQVFRKVHHQIVGSNSLSLSAARHKAHRMGMNTMILSSSVSGESSEIAHFYAAMAREIRSHGRPVNPPACLIAGGETTVTLQGDGKGGRCQELALAAALLIQDLPRITFLAAGTDGIDGGSDAAGAVADSTTVSRGTKLGMDASDFLKRNDSNTFFSALEDTVCTGPTGTNVMDVHFLLIG